MKNVVLILLILTTFSCARAKKETRKDEGIKSDKITGTTEITFNEEIHDFGMLESGEIVVSTFVFTNSGENNLIIKKVESDCGCIHIKFTKEAVKPGATGLIEVEFDSSGMFGKQFKSIEIHSNCKEPKHLAIFAAVKNENLEIIY